MLQNQTGEKQWELQLNWLFKNKTRNPLIIFMEENPGMLWETGKLEKSPIQQFEKRKIQTAPSETMPKTFRGWETKGDMIPGRVFLSAVIRPKIPFARKAVPGAWAGGQAVLTARRGSTALLLLVPSCRCWAPSFSMLTSRVPCPLPLHRHTQSRENEVSSSGIAKA